MNKDKKRQVKPEGKIKHMLRTNYWLTPLLLVALVFAIVFGISKIPALKTTIQGWFHKHEKCKQCEQVTFAEFKDQIAANTDDKIIYVLFSQADNEEAKKLYPVLDKFLESNKAEKDIEIITVDITMKDSFTYNDSTITTDNFDSFKQEFSDKLPDKGALVAPTVIKYKNSDMIDSFQGPKTYQEIMEFFEVNN